MLVFSRKPGEKVVIGGNITVEVFEIRGDKVCLSFDAPANIVIDRMEVHEAKQAGKTFSRTMKREAEK